MLDKERREFGLSHDGQLRICAADISFPVRVLCRVGRWPGSDTLSIILNCIRRWRTFRRRCRILLRARARRGVSDLSR